jgi:hypothetical protein
MKLTESIKNAWSWSGIKPEEVIGENDFGNLMVRDERGMYWRICPEDLSCKVVADDRNELDAMSRDQEFLRDWHMSALIAEARERLGPLQVGEKYCLKIPGALGGTYGGDNLASIALVELIESSGHLARQIAELCDGTRVKMRVTE